MLIKDAPTVWNTLKGIVCVYKPAEVKCERIRTTLINKICTNLNEMECRSPSDYLSIEGNLPGPLVVKVQPNYADHPLAVGPRYQASDLPCSWANYLGFNTSGVLLFGLRDGTKQAKLIRENKSTRAYRVKGILGIATDTAFKDGKIVERSTWRHIKSFHMEKMLSSMQAAHQRKMFELSGVDIQSQTAYELAVQGPIRPKDSTVPLLYGIKCVEFKPPEFTLEIQCINENEMYFKVLVHEIGVKLHSTAHCTGIRCIRHSYFTVENALLSKHFNLQEIMTNMEMCNAVISENRHITWQEKVALRT